MVATPAFGIPYPVGTDRVMDGDNAMQALAERVDAMAKQVALPSTVHAGGTALGAAAATILTANLPAVTKGLYLLMYSGTFTCPGSGAGNVTLTVDAALLLTRVWNNDGVVSDMSMIVAHAMYLGAGAHTILIGANNTGAGGAAARSQELLLIPLML